MSASIVATVIGAVMYVQSALYGCFNNAPDCPVVEETIKGTSVVYRRLDGAYVCFQVESFTRDGDYVVMNSGGKATKIEGHLVTFFPNEVCDDLTERFF